MADLHAVLDKPPYSPALVSLVGRVIAVSAVSAQQAGMLLRAPMSARKNSRRHTGLATVGELIRRYSRDRGLTQQELADKSGLSSSYIARVQTGVVKSPGLDSLRRIAEALELPLSALVSEPEAKSSEVEKAILGYPGLDDESKRALIRMFRALDGSKE